MTAQAQTMKYLQVRISPKLRDEVEAVFDRLGLSPAQAVKLFFNQVALHRAIPFGLNIPQEEKIPMVSDSEEEAIGISLDQIKRGKCTTVDMSDKKQVKDFFGV